MKEAVNIAYVVTNIATFILLVFAGRYLLACFILWQWIPLNGVVLRAALAAAFVVSALVVIPNVDDEMPRII